MAKEDKFISSVHNFKEDVRSQIVRMLGNTFTRCPTALVTKSLQLVRTPVRSPPFQSPPHSCFHHAVRLATPLPAASARARLVIILVN